MGDLGASPRGGPQAHCRPAGPPVVGRDRALCARPFGGAPASCSALAHNQKMKKTMLSKVNAYLAHRRALGFQLRAEGCELLNFARYADGLAHRGPLTRQLAIRWAC